MTRVTAADIERELAARPVGGTLGLAAAPARGELFASWEAAVPPDGEYRCSRKSCTNTCARPGLCVPCGQMARRREAEGHVAAAVSSIPAEFRWASVASDALATRSYPVGAKGTRLDPCAVARRVGDALLHRARLVYVFWGPTKAGKTSLACAALRLILDRAVQIALAHDEPTGAERLAPIAPLPRVVALASGSRFIRAADLAPPRGRGGDPPAYGAAVAAPILILDDSSQENSARDDSANSAERAGATRELILRRWDDGLPILITTPYTAADVGAIYGGGVKRRLFDDERARAIEFRYGGGHGEDK